MMSRRYKRTSETLLAGLFVLGAMLAPTRADDALPTPKWLYDITRVAYTDLPNTQAAQQQPVYGPQHMGRMTCYTGKATTWEDAMKSTHALGPAECSWDMEPLTKRDQNGV